MVKYDLKLLKECANNLMFDMSDEQYDVLLSEFDVITQQMSLLGEIEGLENVEPMTYCLDELFADFREDIPEESIPIEDLLKNSDLTEDREIVVPKVVGGEE